MEFGLQVGGFGENFGESVEGKKNGFFSEPVLMYRR
ncbi:Uncharacterised protein [Tatumella ptyseos]|uniref:Uncharacterized protein n=1 Tax=Tatumella ptyseos TaxID=82987 RepID=A0A2X5NN05_9GAMM|nr:Uncharacterised protein [Tatumella ptyseos]